MCLTTCSPRDKLPFLISSIREPHAQDFLLTIPINGLGQKINPREYRSVLCYRITIPLFIEGSLCPSCNIAKMDMWGEDVFHYSSEFGVKFQHNLVRKMLVDICCKARISVRKEAPFALCWHGSLLMGPWDLLSKCCRRKEEKIHY